MYSDLSEASKVNFFNGFQPLTIFAKSSILVVWLDSECAFGNRNTNQETEIISQYRRIVFSKVIIRWANCFRPVCKSDCKKIGGDICLDATIQRCSQRAAFEEIQRNKVTGEQLTVELWKPFQTTMIRFFAKILNGWM